MKKGILLFGTLAFLTFGFTMMTKLSGLDKSPHDIVYHKETMKPKIKVLYGRPYKNGREIFGNLVKYDKVWRTGANESTEIEFYQKVTIGNKEIEAGTYTLYTIPSEKEWTFILNANLDTWGHYQYKEKDDVLRVKGISEKLDDEVENFTISFNKTKTGADMVLSWDKTQATLPISFE